MQDQISSLQSDLKNEHNKVESLREELRSAQLNPTASTAAPAASTPEMVKKRSFDQLVKEVDQCFAELGRQVQREAKHRQSIEQQMQQLELAMPEYGGGGGGSLSHKAEADIDKRLSKCEAAANELKKDVKKEKKKLEKLTSQHETSQKNQIDQKVIEETIQTILVDVVDELTENEARQFEVFDRRIKEIEEYNELAHQQHKVSDKKTNTELRRLAAIVNTGKTPVPVSSATQIEVPNTTANNDLRITINSIQEKLNIVEDQIDENDERLSKNVVSMKKEMEKFREDQTRVEKREKELDKRVDTLEKQVPTVPGRTVSHGSASVGAGGDTGTMRAQIRELESAQVRFKEELEKKIADWPKATTVAGESTISPAIAALNQKFIEVEVAVDALRTEVDTDRNRAENVRQDHTSKIRSIREELKSLKVKPKKKEAIKVIVSQDVNPVDDDDDSLEPVGPLLEPTKKLNDLTARLVKLEKESTKAPAQIGQTELMRELEMLSEENQRLWRSMTKFEEQLKAIALASHDDTDGNGAKPVQNHPTAPGALAAAINQLQTQITSGMPNEDLDERLRRIEREFVDRTERGTDRLWRHLSNLEEQMTRRHGETDDRLSVLETRPAPSPGDSGLESETPQSNEESKAEPETKPSPPVTVKAPSSRPVEVSRIWGEIGAIKAKMSELTGREILDIKKSLNTAAQRAEVRRLSLDIENMKFQSLKPLEERLDRLNDEMKKRKLERKPSVPSIEFQGRPGDGVSADELASFQAKLDKFQVNYLHANQLLYYLSSLVLLGSGIGTVCHQRKSRRAERRAGPIQGSVGGCG